MDETPIRSGRRPGNPGRMKKGFLWPMLGNRGEMAIFFSPSRARECSRPPQRVVHRYLGQRRLRRLRNLCEGPQQCDQATKIGTRASGAIWEQNDTHPETAGEVREMIGEPYTIKEEVGSHPMSERVAAGRTARARRSTGAGPGATAEKVQS